MKDSEKKGMPVFEVQNVGTWVSSRRAYLTVRYLKKKRVYKVTATLLRNNERIAFVEMNESLPIAIGKVIDAVNSGSEIQGT